MHKVRILHISDLHAQAENDKEPWRRNTVLGDAWDRNLSHIVQQGPIDAVCFTGDAANWGRPNEFKEAGLFLERVLSHTGCQKDCLFVIPGNHDIVRNSHKSIWKKARANLSTSNYLAVSQWMAGKARPPLGFQATWKKLLLQRQHNFRVWLSSMGLEQLLPEHSPHGSLGFRKTLKIRQLPFPVHIIGYDTAWLCGDDADAGKLWLTDSQAMLLSSSPDGSPLPGLRIALMHHPLHELADEEKVRNLLGSRIDIGLRGHLHSSRIQSTVEPSSVIHSLAVGCLFEGGAKDCYANACQTIDLFCNDEGKLENVECWFRRWYVDGQFWNDDDGRYEQTVQGRVNLELRAKKKETDVDPTQWHNLPPRNPTFVGRLSTLNNMRACLLRNPVLILHGLGGVGKSELVVSYLYSSIGNYEHIWWTSGSETDIAQVVANLGLSPEKSDWNTKLDWFNG